MRAAAGVAALLLAGAPAHAAAQRASAPPIRAELRLEATASRSDAAHLLAGANLPLGTYARLGLFAGGGAARNDEGAPARTLGSVRADAIARFLLDPYRQSRWGLSAGGGVTVRHEPGAGTRGWLALVLDLEAPARGGIAPAFQVGVGGGARVGVALRAAGTEGWR